jgi:hypothetical protein
MVVYLRRAMIVEIKTHASACVFPAGKSGKRLLNKNFSGFVVKKKE